MYLRERARKAIKAFTHGISLMADRNVSQKAVQIQTDQLNDIIEYINHLDELNRKREIMIRKLLKVCVAFDIELERVFEYPEGVVDALLLQKDSIDISTQKSQFLKWSRAWSHYSYFHDGSKYFTPLFEMEKFRKINPKLADEIMKLEDETNNDIDLQIALRKSIGQDILGKIFITAEGKLNNIIEFKDEENYDK